MSSSEGGVPGVADVVVPDVTLNLYQRIRGVMSELDYIQKGEKRVNNQYRFVSHDQVVEAIHPLLVKWGIVMVPKVVQYKQDGQRTEVMVEVDFVNCDEPQERENVPALGFGVDPQDKGPGKAVSYAVKYAVLKLFALETGEDPDYDQQPQPAKTRGAVTAPPKTEKKQVERPEFKQRAGGINKNQDGLLFMRVFRAGKTQGDVDEYLKATYGYTERAQIKPEQLNDILAWLEAA